MKIAEIYRSRQGEGLLAGTDSVFVRTSGCNLRCWYCDTPYTSWTPEGEDLALEEVVAEALQLAADHVVITGGEPLLWAELTPLCQALVERGRHITIETAGTLYLPVACQLMSISPKLAPSAPSAERDAVWHGRHERTRHRPEVIRRLVAEHPYQIKLVVDSPADLSLVDDYLAEFPELDRQRVLLMPQALSLADETARATWLVAACAARGLRYCPRRQLEWYGLRRGT